MISKGTAVHYYDTETCSLYYSICYLYSLLLVYNRVPHSFLYLSLLQHFAYAYFHNCCLETLKCSYFHTNVIFNLLQDVQGYGTQGQWSAHMESNRTNESHLRKPQRARNMEISNMNETMRNYENMERKGSRSQYNTSTRYKEEWQ